MTTPFRHCSDELLIEFAASTCSDEQREAVAVHVASCVSCRQRADEYSALISGITSAETWRAAEDLEQLRGEARRQAAVTVVGLERLRELIALPADQWRPLVLAEPDLQSSAIVNGLLDLLDDRTILPTRAYELTSLATDIADLLPLDREGRRTRWRAWSARASALTDMGRYRDALTALDLADTLTEELVDSDLLAALDNYLRADVLRQIDDPAGATGRIRAAAVVFERYRDMRHLAYARFMEAGILYRRRDYSETLHVLLDLVEPLKAISDAPALAQLYLTVGQCFFFTAQYDVAEAYFSEAEAAFSRHGMLRDSVKVEWGRARVMLATGRTADGLRELKRVSKRFEALAMMGEWVLCAVELVEALITTSAADRTITALCRKIAAVAVGSGMKSPYVTALAYLREAAASKCLTPPLARYVREYLEDVPLYPNLQFMPPPIM